MQKPKIYAFSTAYYPFIGGAEIAIEEVSRRLKDRFDFTIVTARMRRDLPKHEVRPEGTVIRLGFGPRFDKWFLPLFAFWKLGFEIWKFRRLKECLVWGMDLSQGSAAAAVLKLFFPHIPFIFTLQYGDGEDRIRHGRSGMIGRAFSFILSHADSVTAISSYLVNLTKIYQYRGESALIPNGVDISRFTRPRGSPRKDKKIIITTSRLVPKNGIDILIRAFFLVRREQPQALCWIIGDGPERTKLESLAASLGISESVKFFGNIPHDDIPKYLWQASVFVRPSRSEGMGNSFVEALAAGLPIIGTPVGGITDIIEDGETGFFVKPDDPLDLAEKIIELFTDRERSRRSAGKGRAKVLRKFSWDTIAESYARVFAHACTLRVVIATPLLPPRLGGPALYASHLEEEFQKKNIRTATISFDKLLRHSPGIRHFVYAWRIFLKARHADIIFSLDESSVGMPVALVARILRIPFVLRLEGDFVWESYIERTHADVTLQSFYRHRYHLSTKERIWRALSSWVVHGAARVVCSSEWRKEIVLNEFRINASKIEIIQNVISAPRAGHSASRKPIILWAGRMLYLKNLYRLIRAFSNLKNNRYELLLIGEGPERARLEEFVHREKISRVRFEKAMSHEELRSLMESVLCVVLPSLSDVGPNLIGEAISSGTPFLMTKESGYAEYVKSLGILVDPLEEGDIKRGLAELVRKETLAAYRAQLKAHPFRRGWPEAARDWIKVFSEIRS